MTRDHHIPVPAALAACLAAAWLAPRPCAAIEVNDHVDVRGHAQVWVTLMEQMEEADELYQFPSGDPAQTMTQGFSLARARVGVRLRFFRDWLEMALQMRLERTPAILDVWAALHVHDAFTVKIGQFKIPGPWENHVGTRKLDFILRTNISENLADFSLSRTTYPSSLFYGIHSYLRDMGIAVSGDVAAGPGRFRYMLMLGNGLGANRFIGGGTSKEYIITNAGQFFLGARVEAAEFWDIVTVGGHVSWNRHDNMVFNSGRTVYDLHRLSWSGDLRIAIPKTGLRLTGMYGGGLIDDDYDDDGRTDVTYHGWEARLVFRLNDAVATAVGGPWLPDHVFEIGARFDRYHYEWNEQGSQIVEDVWTIGIRWMLRSLVDVKLNYVLRRTDDPSLRDLDDDALLLQVQFAI